MLKAALVATAADSCSRNNNSSCKHSPLRRVSAPLECSAGFIAPPVEGEHAVPIPTVPPALARRVGLG